jgi:hypothetical protein
MQEMHNALLAKITFLGTTAIAKPTRKSNPIPGIVAVD